MHTSRKRALNWALVAVGVAMLVLGAVLAATFPWGQAMAAAQSGAAPAFGPWHGPWGGSWGGHMFRGPGFFGGGLLVLLLGILLISAVVRLAARRRWHYRDYNPEDHLDAEEILRRQFAEGRITEDEFKARRDALRK